MTDNPENSITLGELLVQAIDLERQTEAIYQNFARLFSHEPDVAAFWQRYAHDEDGHALILLGLQARLRPERLAEVLDEEILANVQGLKTLLDAARKENVETLDDAYRLAVKIEQSEINAIYRFLLDYASKEELGGFRKFLLSQLDYHIEYIDLAFPSRYRNPAARRELTANAAGISELEDTESAGG